jgi:hypothetical protein
MQRGALSSGLALVCEVPDQPLDKGPLVTKSDRKIMEILEAFDLTRCAHSAAQLAGVDEKTVARYVAIRDAGADTTAEDTGDRAPVATRGTRQPGRAVPPGAHQGRGRLSEAGPRSATIMAPHPIPSPIQGRCRGWVRGRGRARAVGSPRLPPGSHSSRLPSCVASGVPRSVSRCRLSVGRDGSAPHARREPG